MRDRYRLGMYLGSWRIYYGICWLVWWSSFDVISRWTYRNVSLEQAVMSAWSAVFLHKHCFGIRKGTRNTIGLTATLHQRCHHWMRFRHAFISSQPVLPSRIQNTVVSVRRCKSLLLHVGQY